MTDENRIEQIVNALTVLYSGLSEIKALNEGRPETMHLYADNAIRSFFHRIEAHSIADLHAECSIHGGSLLAEAEGES